MKIKPSLIKLKNQFRGLYANGIAWAYYKRFYSKQILNTKPIICDSKGLFEVHVLVCEKDILNTLWTLKTFYHFSSVNPALVIYEDGSLSENSIRILTDHFRYCRIIRRERFHYDMEDFLKDYPLSLKHSKIKSFYCAIKLFGPMYYANSECILYMDTDILFFRKPDEMLQYIEEGKSFFMSDYSDSYTQPVDFFKEQMNINLTHLINAGLYYITKKDIAEHLELMEIYFQNIPEIDYTHWMINRHEQTLIAILLSQANAKRLSGDYQISKQPLTVNTVSHHYVNDGSRPDYYRKGLKYLKNTGFLKAFALD